MIIPNEKCPMCDKQLNLDNVALKDWTDEPEIRLDAMGRAWCKICTKAFDKIDWEEVYNNR